MTQVTYVTVNIYDCVLVSLHCFATVSPKPSVEGGVFASFSQKDENAAHIITKNVVTITEMEMNSLTEPLVVT